MLESHQPNCQNDLTTSSGAAQQFKYESAMDAADEVFTWSQGDGQNHAETMIMHSGFRGDLYKALMAFFGHYLTDEKGAKQIAQRGAVAFFKLKGFTGLQNAAKWEKEYEQQQRTKAANAAKNGKPLDILSVRAALDAFG